MRLCFALHGIGSFVMPLNSEKKIARSAWDQRARIHSNLDAPPQHDINYKSVLGPNMRLSCNLYLTFAMQITSKGHWSLIGSVKKSTLHIDLRVMYAFFLARNHCVPVTLTIIWSEVIFTMEFSLWQSNGGNKASSIPSHFPAGFLPQFAASLPSLIE